MPRGGALRSFVGLVGILAAGPAVAAEAAHGLDGAHLSLLWVLPFVGILLSIALMPLLIPHFWHEHFGKVSAFWALAFLVPFALVAGPAPAVETVVHTVLEEYVPFIILLFALYTVAGGILLRGNLHGSPTINTAFLATGTVLASFIGTTGASMVLIRPLLRANDDRKYNLHVVIFFIFLVSNIGGSLTPLGDPPLFLGYLKGVGFFWTMSHMFAEMVFCAVILLALFYFLDSYYYRREVREGVKRRDPTPDAPLGLAGVVNFPLLLGVIAAVLMSGSWNSGISWSILGTQVTLQAVLRDVILVGIALVSLALTPRMAREGNGFTWFPIVEVAKLFAGIFIAMAPALAILKAGQAGAAAPLFELVTDPAGRPIEGWYFWLTGILSSFLDNAPTYLVFFNLAGGDPVALQGPLAATLTAISCGAVFMGANSYIGNAPNFMVKAIAEERGVRMPSFFGYMAWSVAILVPLFVLLTLIFFR